MNKVMVVAAIILVAGGCAPKYTCSELTPDGKCTTLTQTYEREVLHRGKKTVDDNRERAADKSESDSVKPPAATTAASPPVEQMVSSQEPVRPLRNPPKVVRVWIAPWVDRDDDLHTEKYIYVEIERRKWLIGNHAPASVFPEGK